MSENQPEPTRDELVAMLDAIYKQNGSAEQLKQFFEIVDQNVPHPDFDALFSIHGFNAAAIIDDALAYVPVTGEHALLEKLIKLHKNAANVFPNSKIRSLDDAGFAGVYNKFEWSGYGATPLNSVVFAYTGGDGEHFNFLTNNHTVDEDSPVIYTIPMGGENYIVGENLYDFLCFGMHCGYFCPLTVRDYPDDYFPEDTTKVGQLKNGHPIWFGDEVWEEQRLLLHWLAEELDLIPWTNRKQRFAELQEEYMPLLEIAPDPEY